MRKKSKPTVLVVDDHDDTVSLSRSKAIREIVKVIVRHPEDLEIEDLVRADIVLVDYQLENWAERRKVSSIALKPVDGLALASILRRQIQVEKDAPVAFAIFTGHIEKLAGPLPDEYRQHAVARLNNLEWVFRKERLKSTQICDLAVSVQSLPNKWPADPKKAIDQLAKLLAIRQEDPDAELILQDVESCQPPIHELSKYSHGLIVLRWLLHRILPYPCFLWTTRQLAARLRVDYDSLRTVLRSDTRLSKELKFSKYSGILAQFLGSRWWRVKIERMLWKITAGNSSNTVALRDALRKMTRRTLTESTSPDYPVICLGSTYRPLQTFYSIEDAVRIRPDDWPPYADQAWTTIALAQKHPHLRALVIREDRDKLEKR